MKHIEIKTAQNVTLEYELAGLRERVVAFLIDIVCLVVAIFIMMSAGAVAMGTTRTGMTILIVFVSCVFIFYSLAMEVLNNGQSIGKMAMRLQVIKASGGQATFSDYASRWVFRAIDIYFSLGGIASILVASTDREQRIGDIVANTAVIRIRQQTGLTLDALLAIHQQDAYVPRYPVVKNLEEGDVLLIKSVLDRHAQFQNEAHDEALELLARRIRTVLEVQNREPDDRRFLQTLLKDYVVMTR